MARNFETPFNKLSDICEDIEMESSSDTGAEISELKSENYIPSQLEVDY